MLNAFVAIPIFFISVWILVKFEGGRRHRESLAKDPEPDPMVPLEKATTSPTPSKSKSKSKSKSNATLKTDIFAWPSTGNFNFEIAEESHYQTALNKLTKEQSKEEEAFTATLAPEDNNPQDSRSVRIDINNMTVGYLRHDNARSFRRRLSAKQLKDQSTTCQAIILIDQTTKDQKKKNYTVLLDLKPFA